MESRIRSALLDALPSSDFFLGGGGEAHVVAFFEKGFGDAGAGSDDELEADSTVPGDTGPSGDDGVVANVAAAGDAYKQ